MGQLHDRMDQDLILRAVEGTRAGAFAWHCPAESRGSTPNRRRPWLCKTPSRRCAHRKLKREETDAGSVQIMSPRLTGTAVCN
jgi:hypothetical protein